jgi:hypothetical protein
MGKPDTLSGWGDHGDGSGDSDNVTLLKPALFDIRAVEGIMVEGKEHENLWEI